jgi:hypothetical protein
LGDEGIACLHGVIELTGELCDLLDRQDFGTHRAHLVAYPRPDSLAAPVVAGRAPADDTKKRSRKYYK